MDLKEFGNSINKILNERLTSPFYGTLIVTWLIINWKIVYLTLFVDSNEIDGTKLDFIIKNYSESSNVFWYPILVTILLITVFPFITYLAYWANLYFTDLRKNRKNEVEKNQVLTVEQSLRIKTEIQNQKENFNKLLEDKDSEINILKLQIEGLREEYTERVSAKPLKKSTLELINDQNKLEDQNSLFQKLLSDKRVEKDLSLIIWGIENYDKARKHQDVISDSVAKLRANAIIKKDSNNKDYFSDFGNEFLKYYYEKKN